jgi:hypothetical protein
VTYADIAKGITNIRWRLKTGRRGLRRPVIDFDLGGATHCITEPQDVVLDDNWASKVWIATHYGWLLAAVLVEREGQLVFTGRDE